MQRQTTGWSCLQWLTVCWYLWSEGWKSKWERLWGIPSRKTQFAQLQLAETAHFAFRFFTSLHLRCCLGIFMHMCIVMLCHLLNLLSSFYDSHIMALFEGQFVEMKGVARRMSRQACHICHIATDQLWQMERVERCSLMSLMQNPDWILGLNKRRAVLSGCLFSGWQASIVQWPISMCDGVMLFWNPQGLVQMAKHNQQSNGVSARKSICISNHLELMMQSQQSQQSYISELHFRATMRSHVDPCRGSMWMRHAAFDGRFSEGCKRLHVNFDPGPWDRNMLEWHGMTVFEDVLACLDVMLPYLTKTNPKTINSFPSDTITFFVRFGALEQDIKCNMLQSHLWSTTFEEKHLRNRRREVASKQSKETLFSRSSPETNLRNQ